MGAGGGTALQHHPYVAQPGLQSPERERSSAGRDTATQNHTCVSRPWLQWPGRRRRAEGALAETLRLNTTLASMNLRADGPWLDKAWGDSDRGRSLRCRFVSSKGSLHSEYRLARRRRSRGGRGGARMERETPGGARGARGVKPDEVGKKLNKSGLMPCECQLNVRF